MYLLILAGSVFLNLSPVIFVVLAGIAGIILKVMVKK